MNSIFDDFQPNTFSDFRKRPIAIADPNDVNLSPNESIKRFERSIDIADINEVPIDIVEKGLDDFEKIKKKKERAIGVGLGPMWDEPGDTRTMKEMLGLPQKEPYPLNIGSTLYEIPKGLARFFEKGIGGTFSGTVYDWLGQFIEQGGYAVDQISKLGEKDKSRIYNPYAEAIMSFGRDISAQGKYNRAQWAYWASTGWEAMDKNLQEKDPISYGAGRLSEGVASSALSVLAMYLSGGVAAPAIINQGIQINRGLVALSVISAAGGFEHAQNQGENFYWSTLQGLADGTTEYAMESNFLEGVNTSGKLMAGAKEGAEEFFTGMLQNTRAGILENENKGMSVYQASKKAVSDSLNQAPWEVTAGFVGGYGIAGGAQLTDIVTKANAIPIEVKAPTKPSMAKPTPTKPVKAPSKAIQPRTKAKGGITTVTGAEKQPWGINQKEFIGAIENWEYGGFSYAKETAPHINFNETPVPLQKGERHWDMKKGGKKFLDATKVLVGKKVKSLGEREAHIRFIQQAVKADKPVPREVLEEYKSEKWAQEALEKTEPVTKAERDILGGVDAITRIHDALKQAKAVQPLTKAQKKEALKQRVAAAAGAMKSNVKKGTPTEEAIFKSTGLLKGQLTEYDQLYTSIEDVLEPYAKEAAYQKIYNQPELRYFEVLNTATSFKKLLAGTALTPTDVKNIERVFGKTFKDITSARIQKSDLYDRIITIWKAGLLTGIKTSGLNTLANMNHAMTETAKDVPASFVDSVASLFTGERTLAFTTKGTPKGTIEGFERGWKYLTTGIDARNVGAKLDYKAVHFGNSKVAKGIQAYEETIFHLLGAEDQPFYYGAKARSLYSQAIAQARNKGLKGADRKTYIENAVENPTDKMLEWAVHDAEIAVFQNRTHLGDVAKAFQKVKGGEIIVPFGRTPSAVAMQIINYSPTGYVKAVAEQIHKGEFNQRTFSQAFGRATVGTGALFIGALLFRKGMMNLDYPDNERERKLWELEGRKPNSIKIGDKWRNIQTLGPVGNVLIIGGYFQQSLNDKGSPTEAIVEAMAGGAKSFSEQTFVRGVNMAVEALVEPERSFENWFTSMAGSAVPTIVADIARAMDEQERRSKGPIQRLQTRIPVVRKGLEPRIDVFGQDLPRYGGNVLESMIDPSRPSKIKHDIVIDELRRLWDKDIKVSPTMLGDKEGYDILTSEENTQLWQRAGELTYKTLLALVNSDLYKSADDYVKGKYVEQAVRKTKEIAKAEVVVIKLNQGTSIMKLAESDLLSIENLDALKYYNILEEGAKK